VARLIGDQPKQNELQLAAIEHPAASATPFVTHEIEPAMAVTATKAVPARPGIITFTKTHLYSFDSFLNDSRYILERSKYKRRHFFRWE
jgi:hypothetical protein